MILVTGAAGLVGEAVARALIAAGHAVVATDLAAPATPLACPFVAADLREAGVVADMIAAHAVDRVVHAGAISGGMVAPKDPYLVTMVNVTGSIHLAEACRLAGVRRLIALSSIGVYGDQAGTDPVPEDAPLNASDVYSCSKIAMERILHGYRAKFGLPATVLRISSIYGPGRRTPCFVRGLLDAALEGRAVTVSDDTVHRRQFVHIDDAARAVCLALLAADLAYEVYNVTGGIWLTEGEVAAIVREAAPELRAEVGPIPPLALDGRMGPLAIDRAQADLGYAPKVSLAEGVGRFAAYLRQARAAH
jgi:nucleoside-diphosphate-sugar epimerase